MYRLLKKYEKHQKKILAVFSVGLMIVFAWPMMMQGGGGGDQVAATLNGHSVMGSNLNAANREWEYLSRSLCFVGPPRRPQDQPDIIPSTVLLGSQFGINSLLQEEIRNHPEMFYLLLQEARQSNASVDPDTLRSLELEVKLYDPDARNVIDVPQADQGSRNAALSDLLLINDMIARIAAMPKASVPRVQHSLVDRVGLSLNLVEYLAKDYLSKAPEPTAAEINAQYEKYKNVLPDSNPFGFSYRVENRVKLEYLRIDREQVRKMVEPAIDEIQAREYYHLHEGSFTTRPSTAPSAFSPGMDIAADIAATTQPFEAVRDRIYRILVKDKTDAKMDAITQKIIGQMTSDYNAYMEAAYPQGQPPATAPVTQTLVAPTTSPIPNSSVGVPYISADYLPRLAAQIKQQDKIDPATAEPIKLMTAEELGELPDIGQATWASKSSSAEQTYEAPSPVSLSTYAIKDIRAFAAGAALGADQPRMLSLMEPSQVLSDPQGDRYIFRVIGADPAHAPPQVAVFNQVKNDVRKLAALKLARDAAQKLVSSVGEHHLRGAADAQKLPMITTGIFSSHRPQQGPIRGVPTDLVPIDDQQSFLTGAFKIVADGGAGVDKNHPVGIIELGKSGEVLVAEVNEVVTRWAGNDGLSIAQYQAAYSPVVMYLPPEYSGVVSRDRMMLLSQWFSWDVTKARLNYVPSDHKQ